MFILLQSATRKLSHGWPLIYQCFLLRLMLLMLVRWCSLYEQDQTILVVVFDLSSSGPPLCHATLGREVPGTIVCARSERIRAQEVDFTRLKNIYGE